MGVLKIDPKVRLRGSWALVALSKMKQKTLELRGLVVGGQNQSIVWL